MANERFDEGQAEETAVSYVKHSMAGFVIGLAALWCGTASASPPVNQTIGRVDVAVGSLTEADCRVCHDAGVPDRHHLLYGQPVPAGSVVLYPDGDGDGVPDTAYGCLNCHDDNFTVVRDCAVCHTASAHHATPAATSGDCQSCHGALVDNIGDGHYIPTYDPSLVTPAPTGGLGLPNNSRGNGAGACNYCHDDDGLPTPVILTNQELHHDATLNCGWCHVMHGAVKIRVCAGCHGPDSLHNIQADSPNTNNIGTIVVGGEDAGYGHVGRDAGPNDSDCWGCHGFSASTLAPFSGPIIPTVYSSDRSVIDAGADTVVTLRGSGFTNVADGTEYRSVVVVTAADGSSVTLKPDALAEGKLVVTIPGDTAAGNHNLQAVKTDKAGDPVASNPVSISIRPQVVITDVTCDAATITIAGSGFSGYAAGSGTSVVGNEVEFATIVSWSDTKIVAEFNSTPEEVTVNSVFGRATAKLSSAEASSWIVNPLLGPEFRVTFEPLEGFLVVRTSYADGDPDSISLGMEFGNVIFWMDVTGAIFIGTIYPDGGMALGMAFCYNGSITTFTATRSRLVRPRDTGAHVQRGNES